MKKPVLWETIDRDTSRKGLNVKASSCYIGLAFFVTNVRKPWGRGHEGVYFGANSIHRSFSVATEYAETKRERGSWLEIKELPSMIINGTKTAVCITNIDSSFRKVVAASFDDLTLRGMVDSLLECNDPKTFLHLSVSSRVEGVPKETYGYYGQDSDSIPALTRAVGCYRSEHGGDGLRYALNWNAIQCWRKPDWDSILEFQKKIARVLRP